MIAASAFRAAAQTLALALSLAAALPGGARAQDFAWDALTADEARADIAAVRRAMDHAYPGFGRFADRAAFEAALDQLEASPPADSRALYAGLARALAVLQDSHLVLEADADWDRHAARDAVFAPWRCDIREGRVYAAAVAAPARAEGLYPGNEVLTIDGVPAADYVSAAAALLPQDGDSARAREAQLCGQGDFPGSDLDHYAAFLFPLEETQALTVRGADGEARQVAVSRLTLADLAGAFGGTWANRAADAERDLVYLPLSDDGAYLRVAGFEQGKEGQELLSAAFEDMFLRGARSLVLDLRGNSGGSTLMALTLLRYLSEERVRMVTLAVASAPDLSEIADIVRVSDRRLLAPDNGLFAPFAGGGWRADGPDFDGMLVDYKPLQPAFGGELYVLIDPLTDSSAALVAAKLKQAGRATLIGEATGGSAEGPVAGMFAFLSLPNSGHMLHIPLLRQYGQPAERPEQGVAPDVKLRPALADLIAGRDPVLARALELAGATAAPDRPEAPADWVLEQIQAAREAPPPPEAVIALPDGEREPELVRLPGGALTLSRD